MTGRLSGKTVIVTGGARGYGMSFCLAVTREGANVVLASRTLAECEKVAESLVRDGGSALPIRADITDEVDVARMVEATISRFGRIDVLINNAGHPGSTKDVTAISLKEWKETFDVNVHGTFLCTRAVLPHLYVRRSGHVVNVTSGTSAWPKFRQFRSIPYTTSKAAVDGFSFTLSVKSEPYGVRVNAFIPGLAETKLLTDMPPGFLSGKRCQTPDHVMAPLIYLLTEDFPTGEPFDAVKWLDQRDLLERFSYIHE